MVVGNNSVENDKRRKKFAYCKMLIKFKEITEKGSESKVMTHNNCIKKLTTKKIKQKLHFKLMN